MTPGGSVRWDDLFADLEAQADAVALAERDAEVAERTRYEVGRLTLLDRLGPAVGHPIRLTCAGVGPLHGRLDRLGPDWLLLGEGGGRATVVRLGAVTSIAGLGALSVAPKPGRVAARLDFRHAVRGLGRDRAPVRAVLIDGGAVTGTVDRVGADFVEIAEHPAGESRRPAAVRQVRTVPLAALAVVRGG